MLEGGSEKRTGGLAFLRLLRFRALTAGLRKWRTARQGIEGAELLEVALALPLLLIMAMGILDFANAYNLKQKLANAAREGARLGAWEDRSDLSVSNPATVQSIKDDVTAYLAGAGVNTSFIATSMSSVGLDTWTYYSSGSYGLKIERSVPVVTANGTLLATRVTLTYPYNWLFGFDHIVRLVDPSSSYSGTVAITTDALMYQ